MVLPLRRRLLLRQGDRRVWLRIKNNQRPLRRQVACQFEGKRHIPLVATDHEKRHGPDTIWMLRSKEAPDHIKVNWPGSAWILEVKATTTRKGKRELRQHQFITSLRTAPEALLRLIRQRWKIENEWHWARHVQLGEDAHRCANRNGVPVFAFLWTVVMNLLRRGGYRSIRQGFRELAYDIQGILALGGMTMAAKVP